MRARPHVLVGALLLLSGSATALEVTTPDLACVADLSAVPVLLIPACRGDGSGGTTVNDGNATGATVQPPTSQTSTTTVPVPEPFSDSLPGQVTSIDFTPDPSLVPGGSGAPGGGTGGGTGGGAGGGTGGGPGGPGSGDLGSTGGTLHDVLGGVGGSTGGATGGPSGGPSQGTDKKGGGGDAPPRTISLTFEPASLTLEPGGAADVVVKVTASGATLPVSTTLAPPADLTIVTATLAPLLVTVPAGGAGSATLHLTVPDTAAAGIHALVFSAMRADTGERATTALPLEIAPPASAPGTPDQVPQAQPDPDAGSPASTMEEAQAPQPVEGGALAILTDENLVLAGATGGAGVATLLAYLVLRREGVRLALLMMLATLFARRGLDAKQREHVVELVRQRPGISYAQMRAITREGPLTLAATLRTLEASRRVKASSQGAQRVFHLPLAAIGLPKRQ